MFNKLGFQILEAYSIKDRTEIRCVYARRNEVIFHVENPLNNIEIRTYALETTLLTWSSKVRPESTITPRSRIDSAHTVIKTIIKTKTGFSFSLL